MNIIPENIPQELRDMQRWIVWLLVPNPDPKKKPIKEPHSPFTGIKCDPTVASSASDFATALEAYSRMMMSGIGFVTIKEDNLVFLDFDHCVDENGTWNEATKLFFSHRPTYCEMSPSGTGLRAVYHGVLPPLPNDKTCVNNQLTGLEMYEQKHYLTFTGNKIENAPDFVAEDDGIIAELYDKFGKLTAKEKKKRASKKKAHRTEPLSDYELLVRIREASGADDFDKLWNGELDPKKYGSQSDADFALCCKLAFWTGRDAEQMDRLFRQSKLYREKWDVSHSSDGSTYGAMSIAKACDSVTDIYAPDAAIFESKGVLFRRKGDNVYPLTNFVVVPIEMIVAEDETQMTAELVTSSGETHNLVFMTSDFANMQKFKNVLNKKTIALAYYGADGDLEVLKGYISELEWNVKKGVKALGIYVHGGRNVFVSGKTAVAYGGVTVPDIVQLQQSVIIETELLSAPPLDAETLRAVLTNLLAYNDPGKCVTILAWSAGCFLKPLLHRVGIKFPLLFLIGEAGSGKSTTLERVILPIFRKEQIVAAPQITAFALTRENASSNLIPQALDEFKPSKIDKMRLNSLYNHYRDAYDSHDVTRGRSDQSVITYKLTAPVVTAGEESADEAAVRDRSLQLMFSKKNLKSSKRRDAVNRLRNSESALNSLGRALLDCALGMDSEMLSAWHLKGTSLFNAELPPHVISNLAVAWCGLRFVEKLCTSLGVDMNTVIRLADCPAILEFAVKDALFEGSVHNKSVVEQAFEVMSRMELVPNVDFKISSDRATLDIRLNTVYDKFTKYRRDHDLHGEALEYAQFKQQLKISDILLDANALVRWGSWHSKVWRLNFELLSMRTDVWDFVQTGDIPPLEDGAV